MKHRSQVCTIPLPLKSNPCHSYRGNPRLLARNNQWHRVQKTGDAAKREQAALEAIIIIARWLKELCDDSGPSRVEDPFVPPIPDQYSLPASLSGPSKRNGEALQTEGIDGYASHAAQNFHERVDRMLVPIVPLGLSRTEWLLYIYRGSEPLLAAPKISRRRGACRVAQNRVKIVAVLVFYLVRGCFELWLYFISFLPAGLLVFASLLRLYSPGGPLSQRDHSRFLRGGDQWISRLDNF